MGPIKEKILKPQTNRLFSAGLLIAGLLIALLGVQLIAMESAGNPKVFFGMDIGYGDEEVAIKLIDEVSDYVNLIIIGSLEVTMDTEALTRVCDYMYQRNLYFIIYSILIVKLI